MSLQYKVFDVLIIGSGLAAVATALHTDPSLRVLLVTKGDMAEANSDMAQGGIATAQFEKDARSHLEDTMFASKQTADRERVRLLVEEGRTLVDDLADYGVEFDRDGDRIALGREGAHSCHRVVHMGGDETGRHLMARLRERLPDHVTVLEQTLIDTLHVTDGRVTGASGFQGDMPFTVQAGAVVLATGGIGGLIDWTSNCKTVTGDGLVLAARAGAELRDLDQIQFHPTLLMDDVPVLVTEALRGAGAVLVDEAGRELMRRHPLKSLAPRDEIARAITEHDGTVYLDTSGVERLPQRFPKFVEECERRGLPLTHVPVRPGLHFHMGGVAVDENGRTSVPGLYAVGEVASTGVHGQNRLASNSLLECWVFGKRVAAALQIRFGPVLPRRAHSYDLDEAAYARLRQELGETVTVFPSRRRLSGMLRRLDHLPYGQRATRHARERTLQIEAARLVVQAMLQRMENEEREQAFDEAAASNFFM